MPKSVASSTMLLKDGSTTTCKPFRDASSMKATVTCDELNSTNTRLASFQIVSHERSYYSGSVNQI